MSKVVAVAVVSIKELVRRKDFYVLFILTALITLLLGSVNFFNQDHIARYLKEVCLLLIWVAMLVMAVVTAARQVPSEIEGKTIFPLLAKPVSRGEVLLGKFAGCWMASGMALLVFYLFFAVLSASREQTMPLASYIQAFWLHWVMLAMVTALTLWGSLLLSAPSSNATIVLILSAGILLVGEHLNKVAAQMTGLTSALTSAIYYAMPHFEFYDMRSVIIHNWGTQSWGMVLLATLYGAFYTALFLLGGWLVFRRKVLNP
jgi:ABC-type transport system involved in multi-copper enzyme maturation permease subunit